MLGSLFVLPFDIAISLFWAPIALAFHFEGLTNTSTHSWNKDIPVNKMWVNIFMFCEGWHKIHHDYPSQARLSKYDILGLILEKLDCRKK